MLRAHRLTSKEIIAGSALVRPQATVNEEVQDSPEHVLCLAGKFEDVIQIKSDGREGIVTNDSPKCLFQVQD